MKRHLSEVLVVSLAFFGLVMALHLCSGCKSPQQAGANAAEATYTSELLRCVDEAHTLAESKACRQQVNARWGITEVEAGAK